MMIRICILLTAVFFIALTASEHEQGLQVIEYYDDGSPVQHSIRSKRQAAAAVTSSNGTILECYQFTWPGVTENNTVPDCSRIRRYTPCYTPFVFTNDTTEPQPSVVKEYCRTRGCKVTCGKTAVNTCVRYAYYRDNKPVNISYFCGSVEDTTDNIIIKNGEVQDTIPGGEVRRVKFCQGDLCNNASHLSFSVLSILVSTIAFLITRNS